MDLPDSQNVITECRIKTEIPDDPVEECPVKTEVPENPLEKCSINTKIPEDSLQELAIKTEISANSDEDSVEFEISENPLYEPSIKTEVVEDQFLSGTPQDEEDMLPKDPLEPTLYRRQLNSQARHMLLNVIRYFQKFRLIRAKETGEDMNVTKAVADATGVSASSVTKLLAEYRKKGLAGAIATPPKRVRKVRTDTIAEEGDEDTSATVTIKNKRKKK